MAKESHMVNQLVKTRNNQLLFSIILLIFLVEKDSKNSQGNLIAFMTTLELINLHDIWIIDYGATDYMSNKLTFMILSHPSIQRLCL
jgi:hypothetical protein